VAVVLVVVASPAADLEVGVEVAGNEGVEGLIEVERLIG
jgi:hypothetical protein